MKSLRSLALTLLSGGVLAVGAATGAYAEEVTGKVYQIEPGNVYVEAVDHTAVKVPISSAIFTVHGNRVGVDSLRIGTPVDAVYTPDSMLNPYEVIYVAPVKVDRVMVREFTNDEGNLVREYTENGATVRYVWFNGRWHRHQM